MKSTPLGYLFAFIAYSTFSIQDAISKHLGDSYSPFVVAFFRYWAFIAFALFLATRAPGGLRQTLSTKRPVLQVMRGLLLAIQIVASISAFHYVGLAQSQSVFAAGPIFVALLSVPLLGEKVGWRRWTAILVGLVGVLFILSPSTGEFSYLVVLPLGCALAGALYAILTRLASRTDPPVTSFFFMCLVGFAGVNVIAPFTFSPIAFKDWGWMAALCCTGIVGHFSLIRAYDNASAVLLQPISYWQLVMATSLAVIVFGESLTMNMVVGAVIVVAAGLFTVWREQVVARRERRNGGVAATPQIPH